MAAPCATPPCPLVPPPVSVCATPAATSAGVHAVPPSSDVIFQFSLTEARKSPNSSVSHHSANGFTRYIVVCPIRGSSEITQALTSIFKTNLIVLSPNLQIFAILAFVSKQEPLLAICWQTRSSSGVKPNSSIAASRYGKGSDFPSLEIFAKARTFHSDLIDLMYST